MSVWWGAAVRNPDDGTAPATGTGGEAADRDAAIGAAIAAARKLTRRPDGSVWPVAVIAIQPHGTNRAIDVDIAGWDEPGLEDAQMRVRVEDALMARARRLDDSETRMRQVAEEKAARGPVWHRTPSGSVGVQWARILEWLRRNGIDVSAVTRPGVDDVAITAAIEATGVAWPAELVELYRLTDGDDGSPLFPSEPLLPLSEVAESHSMMVEIGRSVADEFGGDDPPVATAGGVVGGWAFRPEYVPFAGIDGYWLVVDTRPGELHGCVTHFDKYEGDSDGPQWRSISAMLTDFADSLETGRPFARWWRPNVTDGVLTWEFQQ